MKKLANCPNCGQQPELVDDRLVFYVRCNNHPAPWTVIYGPNYRYIDGIEDEDEAQSKIDSIDWDAAEQGAVDNWNKWVSEHALTTIHVGELDPAERLALARGEPK